MLTVAAISALVRQHLLASPPGTYLAVGGTATGARVKRLSCGRVFVEYAQQQTRRTKSYPAHKLDEACDFAVQKALAL